MGRKDVSSTSNTPTESPSATGKQEIVPPQQQGQSFPLVAPSTVANIAVHSLLMITVPFALFFATHFGGFDSLFQLTGTGVPNKSTKTYLGAGLAVLGVNLVIASFVVCAFREQPVAASKKDD